MLVGLGGTALVTLVFAALPDDVPTEIPALLLLVPITIASVLSSWRAGLPVAVVAGLTHAFVVLPPFGEVHFGYTEDVVTLVTFVAVAGIVSVVVSRRSLANQAELIGHERMLLLRSVSHDIRNPLNAILTAATELDEGADHDPATRHRLLSLVIGEATRLDRIVANLLSLSRLQAGALAPACQPIPLDEILDRAVERFDHLCRPGDRIAVDDLPPAVADLAVDVDVVQIDQVLANLVENTVRHAPDPVTVRLGAALAGGLVELSVVDDGPGFSPAARQSLFSPFRSSGGSSGLGLTVCRAIVEAHGGTIAVDDGPDGGTCIRFTVCRAG